MQLVAAGGHPALSRVVFFCILFGAEPSANVRQGTNPWVGQVGPLDLLLLPRRLGRGMGHPAALYYGSTFPGLPFCFDK